MVLVRPAVFKTVRLVCKTKRRFDSPCPFLNHADFKMKRYVTIGVAGHVDHGKTSFVLQLTDVDTDRHPEEKRRGLSIDAGIACWPRSEGIIAAFVDVPGHRDFLKNTICGLQGVDIGVLVVAADDGVMVQTREHLDILSFFQVKDGIVVLSKADCVDSETLELAELEIMELTASTFLDGKPIIRFSNNDGRGKDETIAALDLAIAKSEKKPLNRPFRLWIDQTRSFVGIGTVVSGTVLSGIVKTNDTLQILPDAINTRVRSLEQHGQKIAVATAGQRIGLNLHRIGPTDIKRGMCLVWPREYPTVSHFNTEMRIVQHAGINIKDRQKVKIYIGSSVHKAIVKFIDSPCEKTGGALAQLQLNKTAAVAAGDHFVITPMNTNTIIGGGNVLELGGEKVRKANKGKIAERLSALQRDDISEYIEQLCQLQFGKPLDPQNIVSRTTWRPEEIKKHIESEIQNGKLIRLDDGKVARNAEVQHFTKLFNEILTTTFQNQPNREPMQLGEIINLSRPTSDEKLAALIIENLCQHGNWVKEKGGIRPADFKQRIPDELTEAAKLLRSYAVEQGIRPFSADYFVKRSTIPITLRQTQRTLDFFCKTGEMVRLKNDRYLTLSAIEEIKKKVNGWIADKGIFCLRDCKDALDFNRGLGLPVLEYLDRVGFTIKHGEGRTVAAKQPYIKPNT